MDIVDHIIKYEGGEMTDQEVLDFFSTLVKDKTAWSLQGHYGRTASALIQAGYISQDGEILKEV